MCSEQKNYVGAFRGRAFRRGWSAATFTGAFAALSIVPDARAAAHGIEGSAVDKGTWEFIPLGIEHMLLGYDHLLFIVGVVLLAGQAVRAAKFISLFALGHSATLILATLAGWRLNATFVDVIIALSLVFVGVVGIRGRPTDWRPFGVTVFAFGLVHGLGLSTRLQDLRLPDDGLLGRVIAFNVGIEIGQLLVISVLAVLGALLSTCVRPEKILTPAYSGIALVGVVAAAILGISSRGEPGPVAVASATGTCTVRSVEQPSVSTGGHPPKRFYGPEETAPEGDFGHVIGDGLVVVRYEQGLTASQIADLKAYVVEARFLVGGAATAADAAVRAIAQDRTLTCTEFDLPAVKEFSNAWFEEFRDSP